jgi:hypothetical protein
MSVFFYPAGFGKIYLYDHESKVPLSEELHELIAQGYIKYIRFNGDMSCFCFAYSVCVYDVLCNERVLTGVTETKCRPFHVNGFIGHGNL